MITVYEWYGWGLSVSVLIYFMQMAVLLPFERYRDYSVFDAAKKITRGVVIISWVLIWAASIYFAPVAMKTLQSGTLLGWIVASIAFTVPAFWLLRMYLIRKMLRPPPTHPSRQHERR